MQPGPLRSLRPARANNSPLRNSWENQTPQQTEGFFSIIDCKGCNTSNKILGKRISLIDGRNTYSIPLLLKACSYVCRWVAQYQERIQFLDREYFCRRALRIPEGNLAALSHRLGGHYPEPPVAELSSRPDGTFWDTKENFRLKLEQILIWIEQTATNDLSFY